ncbi:arylsulfotransferase family protein [Saccharopolyspora sp. TS4A08]|uniref:Arylsulfotransferase family protein n=1 Tax=Saccharopolyspora ipomoeae TaxID=3042027 RepID=A0ABT6PSZ6_9PSEU|nr:arylsulfotransferase family protein [Saccharopolyspora sp. TS4A08]MDI2031129.1 arylsulfotransferase family protein [Saccharopolyspora sp. TS4A08]
MTALVAAAIPGAAAPPVPSQYASRPDLSPPQVQIESPARGTEPGYIFLDARGTATQGGPMIVDDSGQPVWFRPYGDGMSRVSTSLRTQTYRGQPVLTWWEGDQDEGWGDGEFHVLDQSYEEVATVRTGNGVDTDLHDMTITPRDTALLLGYHQVERDGRQVVEGVIQEVDIATGRVLFDWRSLDHVGLEESTIPAPADPNALFDYLHPNSVTEDANGNLLLSARNTDAVYQIDRATGAIQWRLGGVRSDFAVDPAARFARQHDARWLPTGQLSIFDNASDVPGPPSRGIVVDLDPGARTARLAQSVAHPGGTTSPTQGSYQVLPGGHHFVGWGSQGQFTEYDAAGGVVLHASLGDGMQSYRALRLPWVGTPKTRPDVAIRDENGTRALYTSWNGATEVRGWRLLAGDTPFTVEPVGDVAKAGFETRGVVAGPERYVAVEALDAQGRVLGRSDTVS